MSLFKKNPKEKRSIEDILTPKDEKDVETLSENQETEATTSEENTEEKIREKVKKTAKTSDPFNSSEFNALTCFGWKEEKTDKWLIKSAKVWFFIMSFAWFIFGTITFAPILFISNKIDVIFNDRKKSLVFGAVLYVALIALIVLLFGSRGGAEVTKP